METFPSTQDRLKPPRPVVAIVAYLFVSAWWFAWYAIVQWRFLSPSADVVPFFSYSIAVSAMGYALLSVVHLVSAAGLIGGGNWARLLYICGGAASNLIMLLFRDYWGSDLTLISTVLYIWGSGDAANLIMLLFRDYWGSDLMLISTASYIAVTWGLTRHSVSDYLS